MLLFNTEVRSSTFAITLLALSALFAGAGSVFLATILPMSAGLASLPAGAPTIPHSTLRIPHSEGPVAVPNAQGRPRWVTLQAGHWRNHLFPDELAHLKDNGGASSNGVNEVDLNVAVARLAASFLEVRGYKVEVLEATVPVSYTTDLFLSIHADGNNSARPRGFKAVAPWNGVAASDGFVGILYEEYGKATGLPTDPYTSVNMAHYYAFNSRHYRHATDPRVPAALLEMGFVTNPEDRKVLVNEQERIAWGVANAVDRYFRSGLAGKTPTPYPSFTPTRTSTRTPTNTPTSTSTPTATPTETATPVPTESSVAATQTASLITPAIPTGTPRQPTPTRTPQPTPTPLAGIITADGRRLPPLAQNGRNLPQPGSKATAVLLDKSEENLLMSADGRERQQVWQQFYVPELGRPVWRKGIVRYYRP